MTPVAYPARLRVGTRGSALALAQTNLLIGALQDLVPDLQADVIVIRTQGDADHQTPLAAFDGQGVFVREIERALRLGTIDCAVHSYKDMPSVQPDGLVISAFPQRADPRDALVARDGLTVASLPSGARIGTGSPRRRALLEVARPDLAISPLRGNVDTRLRQVAEGALDAVVLAAAGLARLERSDAITELLDPSVFVPAVGQGILAVDTRSDASEIIALVGLLDDPATRACALAERCVAITINAGCQAPFGAYAHLHGSRLTLNAVLLVGSALVREQAEGDASAARAIGDRVGAALLTRRRDVEGAPE